MLKQVRCVRLIAPAHVHILLTFVTILTCLYLSLIAIRLRNACAHPCSLLQKQRFRLLPIGPGVGDTHCVTSLDGQQAYKYAYREINVVLLYKMPEFRAAATIIGGVLNYISCGYIMSVCKSSSDFFLIIHLSGVLANHLPVLAEDKQGFSHCPVALDISCYLHVDGDIPGNWGNARPQAAL